MKPSTPFSEVTDVAAEELSTHWEPNIDIGETPSAYILIAEMPGVRSEHLNLIYEQGFLTIDAKSPPKGYHQWQNVIQDEREKGRCYRVFALPENVDIERRREKLRQGLLTIHLPKLVGAAVTVEAPRALVASAARGLPEADSPEPLPAAPPREGEGQALTA